MTELKEMLNAFHESGHSIDILLLCETYLTQNNLNKCKIKNYSLKTYYMRKK
jgi:hypothetical protein